MNTEDIIKDLSQLDRIEIRQKLDNVRAYHSGLIWIVYFLFTLSSIFLVGEYYETFGILLGLAIILLVVCLFEYAFLDYINKKRKREILEEYFNFKIETKRRK